MSSSPLADHRGNDHPWGRWHGYYHLEVAGLVRESRFEKDAAI